MLWWLSSHRGELVGGCGAPLHSQPPLALWHQSRGVWRCRFLGAVLCNLQIIESAQKRLPEAPGSGLAGIGSDKPSGLKMSASALADLPRSAGNCHFLCSCKGEQAAHFVKDKNFFSPYLHIEPHCPGLAQWKALGQLERFQCL